MCEIKEKSSVIPIINRTIRQGSEIEIEISSELRKKSTQIESHLSSIISLGTITLRSRQQFIAVIMAVSSAFLVLVTLTVLWSELFKISASAKEAFYKRDWRERQIDILETRDSDDNNKIDNTNNLNSNNSSKSHNSYYETGEEVGDSSMYLCSENSTDCLFIVRHAQEGDHHEYNNYKNLSPQLKHIKDFKNEGREILRHSSSSGDGFTPDFSDENQRLRLRNGTILSKKPLDRKNKGSRSPFPKHKHGYKSDESDSHETISDGGGENSSASDNGDNNNDNNTNSDELTGDRILSKKVLAVGDHQDNATGHKKESLNKGETESEDMSNQSRIIAYTIRPTSLNRTTALGNYPTITLASLARQLMFPNWFWTKSIAPSSASTTLATTTRTNRTGLSATTGLRPITQLPSISFDNNFSRFLKLFTLVRFENTACSTGIGQNGTCYNSRECADLGGTAAAQCANGFGVCCVFQVTCGGLTSRNGSYFTNSGVTFAANQVQTCSVTILKTTPLIKQMRLDFQIFSLRQPVAGSCEVDRFIISGQNTNNIIPILCGQNTGSHIYVETTGSSNGIQLSIMTTGEGSRSWRIRITQYATLGPPSHCLQYNEGVMGTIRSFNYISDTSPQYLNNLNYAICIRREAGFCSVTYSNAGPDGTYQPFQIVNANAEGTLVLPSGQAGVGVRDCPYDYININGIRLCGERLNDATTTSVIVQDAPVTDISNGPFIVNVRTNEIDVGGGFNIYFRQNPCMSTPG